MNTKSYFPKAQKIIPFKLADRQGEVAVYYGPNDDAVRAGFDAIPGINFPIALCHGYPAMHARIKSYTGAGYRTLCGWIQIVTRAVFPVGDTERTTPHLSCSLDVVPALHESQLPFAVFGDLPSFFDAPCLNLGNNAELTWVADTFLVTVPVRSRQEEISWLLGFRWGYQEYDNPEENPVNVLPLEVTDGNVWNSHLAFLRGEFEEWRFKEA
jgi:hypothetical protein